MKHLVRSSLLFVLLIAGIFTSYAELHNVIWDEYVYEKNSGTSISTSSKESYDNQQDTSELDDPPPSANELKDVSNMFNERGFYKSSGFSFDDEEIINDFNGNIIYTVPLYNFSVNAGFNMRMKLNYNGSVSHGVMLGSTGTVGNGNKYRYNLNFPEWIIELNGIALQTFNFETNFFTNAGDGQVAYGRSVNALVAGYHYSNEMKAPDETSPDRINILAGDGSVISLQNTFATYPANEPANFRGVYEYKGKELYYKALVSFIGDSAIPAIAKRKIILLKGDGLEYEFEEQVIEYFDFRPQDPVNYYLRPKVIYLKSISDRFSRKISVAYSGEHPYAGAAEQIMGRNLLSSVSFTGASATLNGASVSFQFGTGICRMLHESEINGNYTVMFDMPVSYRSVDDNKHQRAQVANLQNILNQKTEFQYFNYVRRLNSVSLPSSGTMSISMNDIKRLKNAKNYLGLYRHYQNYFGSDSMDITVPTNEEYSIMSSTDTNLYKGQGRDPFYSNMLIKKTDSADVAKTMTTYEYGYSLAATRNISNVPVDSADRYRTIKVVSSKQPSTLNSTDSSGMSIRTYRVYPLYDDSGHFAYSPDKDGITKLIKEELFRNPNENVYTTSVFSYETGTLSNDGFSGSFLMKSKYETYTGASKLWMWSYVYYDNNFEKPVYQTTETDPLGNYSVSKDTLYDVEFMHRPFNSDYEFNSPLIKSYYYQTGLRLSEKRFSEEDNLLAQKTFRYVEDTASALGYPGQLLTERVSNSLAFGDYIETNYEYYKLDTLGMHVFSGTGIFPYKEGNLKLVRTNDRETKYFYHPVTLNEVVKGESVGEEPALLPKLKYKILYNTGGVYNTQSNVWDFRFPIRTDMYKVAGGARDTLSITYKTYTLDGSPSKMINREKYLTQILYEPVHRVNSITLPGDFSTQSDSTILNISSNYTNAELELDISGIGNYNYLDDSLSFTYNFSPLTAECCTSIVNSRYKVQNEFDIYHSGMFFHFDTTQNHFVRNLTEIDSAVLRLYPYSSYFNPSSLEHYTRIHIVKEINSGSREFRCDYCGTQGNPFDAPRRTAVLGGMYYGTFIESPQNYYSNSYDIKSIIPSDKNFLGFIISPSLAFDQPYPYPDFESQIYFKQSGYALPTQYYPTLNIYGELDISDTLKYLNVRGGTIKYVYDNVRHTVDVYSVRNTLENERSKIRYAIDAYGNIGRKSIYTSESDSNSNKFLFNFLNQPARTFDALNDSTMFSYDGLGRTIKIKNSDTSSTKNAYAYYDNMSEYFGGSYSGFIEKQTFEDEEGNQFEKYFDAVGNLRRDRKFIDGSTTGEDPPGYLTTDYWYDSLYRVTKVKTPQGKMIYYSYDGYSRQASRTTPDAGLTKYLYDKNNNLLYSQDAAQRTAGSNIYTFRAYDGLNRLTALGVTTIGSGVVEFDSIRVDSSYSDIESDNPSSNYYLAINAYDTITNSVIGIFTGVNGYAGENFTLSRLAATAYRTRLTDAWNFKYYRYDARGRVTKMWNIIEGFDTLITEYQYNSQDQITMYSHYGSGSPRTFRNSFDYAGRLSNVEFYAGAPDAPNPEYITLAEYLYNENSQVLQQKFNKGGVKNNFYYDNRNRISTMQNSEGIFEYTNGYFKNGNVKSQEILGSYKDNFDNTTDLTFTYTYDKSNRLLETENTNQEYKDNFKLENKYDKDGNILELKRYDGDGSMADNFNYAYYSNTNKLQRVTGSGTQYSYDANGNMLTDDVNRNKDMKYDHRNLITQLRHKKIIREDSLVYLSYYYYDEAGNRIRKRVYQYIGIQPADSVESPDEEDIGDAPGTWELIRDELYSRGADGKELAIYVNGNIKQTNIRGLGHEGHITTSDVPNFYLKDHLGSIRIVTNENDEVISAQDYDCWGYLLESRTYESDESVYKFTGKERDEKSNYDYFGTRYFDSRIGRWGSIDPLFEDYITFSPYSYSLSNPLIYKDPNGKWIARYDDDENKIYAVAEENDLLYDLYNQLGLSEKEFAEMFDIEDLSNYQIVANETTFDITNYVLRNVNFSKDPSNMNCFSSCLTGVGLFDEEVMIRNKQDGKGFTQELISSFGLNEVNELNPGVMKTWVDQKNVTHHSAIFILRNQKGIEYYFGRPGPDSKISIQTSDRLDQLYPDFQNYLLIYP